jgi:hypothetical protein
LRHADIERSQPGAWPYGSPGNGVEHGCGDDQQDQAGYEMQRKADRVSHTTLNKKT